MAPSSASSSGIQRSHRPSMIRDSAINTRRLTIEEYNADLAAKAAADVANPPPKPTIPWTASLTPCVPIASVRIRVPSSPPRPLTHAERWAKHCAWMKELRAAEMHQKGYRVKKLSPAKRELAKLRKHPLPRKFVVVPKVEPFVLWDESEDEDVGERVIKREVSEEVEVKMEEDEMVRGFDGKPIKVEEMEEGKVVLGYDGEPIKVEEVEE